jgi:hypothetical protein
MGGLRPPGGPKNVKEGDDDSDEDDNENVNSDDEGGEGGGGGGAGGAAGTSMSDRRAEARRKAYEEALAAAKITAKTPLENIGLFNRAPDRGGLGPGLTALPVIEGGLLHAYSVGQKGKKKDKPPDEQRPGDWLCECGNYNFRYVQFKAVFWGSVTFWSGSGSNSGSVSFLQ